MNDQTLYEIERRYVISPIPPNLSSFESVEIEQGYLADGVRVRRVTYPKNCVYFRTEKQGTGLVRIEQEYVLGQEEYFELWQQTTGKRIYKTRYHVPLGEILAEVDVFHGNLEGHCIVEFEFRTEADAHAFIFPDHFFRDQTAHEVTQDKRYSNFQLAQYGWPKDFLRATVSTTSVIGRSD